MATQTSMVPLDQELRQRLMTQRIIVLGTELDQDAGNRLCSQLLLLSAENPRDDISFWISSPGGSVPAMLAIRDVMRLIPNDVSTVNLGMAYSAGQFLLSAGTKGKRYSLPHAKVLLHQGSAGIGGTAADIAIQADDLRHTRDTVLAAIADDTGQDVATIERDSRRDRWFTAADAVAYGFVDRVITHVDDIRPVPPRRAGLGG
ncbi:ClpP family protease [uncultured Georgenia sp.]|uniref:ClpP family protease n=1 Tax=uncultured Georgenia sp. TaxID=378209 RepID=UPI00262A1DF7|nr:ATP-dependent Clp protease proteolytic subunit [uncultured Georgenia sp.]